MLALEQHHHHSPTTHQTHLSYFDTLPHAQNTSSPSTINSLSVRSLGYFDTQSSLDSSTPSQGSHPEQYMNSGFHYTQNPAIRIQQSSPSRALQSPQSFTDTSPYDDWSNGQIMANRSLQSAAFQRNRLHQRGHSSSSVTSTASASPYTSGHAPYGYNLNETGKIGQTFANQDQSSNSNHFSNHLPTPTQTPTQESFLTTSYPATSYSQNGEMQGVMVSALAMNNNNIDTHSNADDELPGMSHSGRQSVSSLGQGPSTPRTIPESFDDGFKVSTTDQQMRFPKLDRTVSDAYNDALFSGAAVTPASATSAPKSVPSQLHLSPHRNMINEYLQAAQMARSQSPTSSGSRGVSPFRPSSPYVQGAFGQMQRPYTAASVRQAQQARASQMEMSHHIPQQQDDTPKTISPKDAVLEYNEADEDAKMPLFSETQASDFGQHFGGGQQSFSARAQNVAANSWTNDVQPQQNSASVTSSAPFSFATPALAGYTHSLPLSSHGYRAQAAMKQEETPEFPAHLTTMDSSASEAPPSSANSNYVDSRKPASSTADTGTYTCTFNGCSLRFETPQKLQKHKREGHRNPAVTSPITPGIGSGMTSAQLAARNSQSGPHKCERINPTTGKPCNTIFSRPYDLTRHEDTIHNVRKQKVRCALCVEEKTFSRNDALTRHMRVVHPEVDFPGKHRRRGAHD